MRDVIAVRAPCPLCTGVEYPPPLLLVLAGAVAGTGLGLTASLVLRRSPSPLPPTPDPSPEPATERTVSLTTLNIDAPAPNESTLEAQKLESLGMLAGGIAHDFNNLLMSVLGNASLALMELDDGHAAYAPLREIEIAARRARDLVGQLLAYAGKGNLAPEPIDLNTLVREMGDLLSTALSRKARIQYDFCDESTLLLADPTQVRQVVMNLITNASDAMRDEGGTVRLSTQLRRVEADELQRTLLKTECQPGAYVVLTSADEGCGMDAETLGRIFDPFFTTKRTGRGLGLAAVLGIVRRFGGTMAVESTVGVGTTFRLYFPFAQQVDEDEDLPTEHTSTAAGWAARAGGALLIVDDDPVVMKVTVRMAQRLNFEVISANSGEEALVLYKVHHDALFAVLLDMTMPGMSGLECMDAMVQIDGTVPVILTSGYSEAEIPSLQGTVFLQKPYTLKQLTKALDQASEA